VGRTLRREEGPFDLAFLDPPYATPHEELRAVLSQVTGLIADGGALVLTRPKRDATDVVPIHFPLDRLLTYGDARILVCREAS
jgi:16S rRNA G966 N2-methylase RsmD